jgi:hypothetical protein
VPYRCWRHTSLGAVSVNLVVRRSVVGPETTKPATKRNRNGGEPDA